MFDVIGLRGAASTAWSRPLPLVAFVPHEEIGTLGAKQSHSRAQEQVGMREGFVGIDVELLAHFAYAVQHGVAVCGEGLTRCFE